MRLTALILGVFLLLPARAATVEVTVRERKGGLMEGQQVLLLPVLAPGEAPFFWDRSRGGSAVTGASGKATFFKVAIGRYTVGLGPITGAGLINPSANPLAPPPEITIGAAGDSVSVEIEVWRGSLLSSEIISDRATIPKDAKVILRSLDGQPDADLPVDVQGRVERMLLPGRYEMELVAPPGYLLVDVVWNGESLPGHVVRFDIRDDPRQQSVSWYLSAPCLVTGTVADDAYNCPARVVATLVQPGPWIQAATLRGGSVFQVVPHQEWDEQKRCVYRLWLPEGRWTVRAEGDAVVSSDPESEDVSIVPGETRNLDFHLTTAGGGDTSKDQPLVVSVRTPEGRPLEGSIVEIWPPDTDSVAGLTPLKHGLTAGYSGSISFRGLHAGNYLAGAGRDEYLDGSAKVEGYDPKGKDATRVTVTLREGATLHAHALDEKDHPVQGVELTYTRLEPLPKMRVADESFVAKKKTGSALSDVTGHLEIRGLYDGPYRLDARMTGEQDATRFVLLREGAAKPARSIEERLSEGHRSDIDLLVLPAASLSGGIRCSDRGTLPTRASFRIFPADAPVEGFWRDKELETGAALKSDGVVLRGTGADEFHLGPLSTGAYRLAARPDGQHYWSWALNELVPDRAAVYPADETSVVDTGTVEIECGPVVAVVPDLKSKEAVPDMRLGAVHASLRPAGDDNVRHDLGAEVEPHSDRVLLRRLREGKFKTKLTVEHPYMIPASMTVPEQVLELTRGSMAEIRVVFDKLGGLVEVRGDGKAVRLTPAEGDPVFRPVVDGKADFPGTDPGAYRVDLCGDPECSTRTATWMNVPVRAGATTFLP
jgi:hypothetical protein